MNQSGLKEQGKPRQILLFLLCEEAHWIWAKVVSCILIKGTHTAGKGRHQKGVNHTYLRKESYVRGKQTMKKNHLCPLPLGWISDVWLLLRWLMLRFLEFLFCIFSSNSCTCFVSVGENHMNILLIKAFLHTVPESSCAERHENHTG